MAICPYSRRPPGYPLAGVDGWSQVLGQRVRVDAYRLGRRARPGELDRARHGLPARYILYLGTLEPRKNLTTLLRAYARLRRRGLDWPLVLAGGKGWLYEDIFRTIEELGLGAHVRIPGYVTYEEQPLWYGGATLTGACSRSTRPGKSHGKTACSYRMRRLGSKVSSRLTAKRTCGLRAGSPGGGASWQNTV